MSGTGSASQIGEGLAWARSPAQPIVDEMSQRE